MQQRQRKCSSLFKRVKERSVQMAVEKVEEWRYIFENGKYDSQGNLKKFTLQQAAEEVGIPKKTLEDYHQLIKKAKEIQPIEQLYDRKMGYLRQLIKQTQNFKQNTMETEIENQEDYDSDIDDEIQEQILMKEDDFEDYFNLENNIWEQSSLVMLVHSIPQTIQKPQKKVDPWEELSSSCESNQETEDEEF